MLGAEEKENIRPVKLNWLNSYIKHSNNSRFVLADDLKKNDLLILGKGQSLNSKIIEKLLKYGITEANICLKDELNHKVINDEFSENALLINSNFKEISPLVKVLKEAKFKDKNIYATGDLNILERYFESKKINYLFVNLTSYSSLLVEKLQLLLDKCDYDVNLFLVLKDEDKVSPSSFKCYSAFKNFKNKYSKLKMQVINSESSPSLLKEIIESSRHRDEVDSSYKEGRISA